VRYLYYVHNSVASLFYKTEFGIQESESRKILCARPTKQMKAHVILYTRPGCHLCEEAKAEMIAANCAESYTLEEINIESDATLKELYGWEIPVIFINGVKAFKYRLTSAEFKSKLKRLARS